MKPRSERHQRIIKFLSTRINSPTFQEMNDEIRDENSKKIGRGVLFLGVNELLDEGIITKDKKIKRYSLVTNVQENDKVRLLKNQGVMNVDLDKSMKELREHDTPFELGYALIQSAMYSLPKYTLELNSTRLTKQEKTYCENFIKKCNQTIKKTFEVLEEIDWNQTMILKQGLEYSSTPKFDSNKKNRKKRLSALRNLDKQLKTGWCEIGTNYLKKIKN
jgi:hypothetical protein